MNSARCASGRASQSATVATLGGLLDGDEGLWANVMQGRRCRRSVAVQVTRGGSAPWYVCPVRPALAIVSATLLSCGGESPPPPDRACEARAAGVICAGSVAIRCGAGGSVLHRETCGAGDRCFDGFGCGVCEPGATDCGADDAPRACGADHRWRAVPACAADQVCERGRCVPGCDDDPLARETRGCEFWATQTLNASLGRTVEGSNRDDFPFTVVAANPWRREVTLTLEGGGARAPTVRVAARGDALIETPWNPSLVDAGDHLQRRSGIARGAALHLRATLRVSAWQFNPLKFIRDPECEQGDRCFSYSNDASLLLPANALGRDHVIASLPLSRVLPSGRTEWTRAPGFVSVVGTAAGTQVTVTLRGDIEGSADGSIPPTRAGGRVTATLNAGDVLQLVGALGGLCADPVIDRQTDSTFCRPGASDDLTGSRVTASAPVAVFAGHDCALVPFDRYACDHVEEQIPPVDTLGVRYVVSRARPMQAMRSAAQPEGEPTWVRVVAAYDDTAVTVLPEGVQGPTRLNAGESVSFMTGRHIEVTGSRPILVASFLVGADYLVDPSPRPLSARGDPSMSVELPLEQWRSVHDVYVPQGFSPNFLDVVGSAGTRILVDGNAVTAPPDTGVPGRAVWQIQVAPGLHRVSGAGAQDVVGLRVYGYAPFTSYMARGGGDLRVIPVPQ